MKKILGICAVLALCAATASARTTGPPAASSANAQLGQGSLADYGSIAVADSDIDIFASHNDVAGDIELWFGNTALFMGDETDGLLKGPRTYALDFCGQKTNLSAATEVVNLVNAGKTDATISMSDASRRDTQVAVIHTPSDCGITIIG